jgi:hypothetical protein
MLRSQSFEFFLQFIPGDQPFPLHDVEHGHYFKAVGDGKLFQGHGILFSEFIRHDLPQKSRLDGVFNETFLDCLTYPSLLALGQYLSGPLCYCRDVAPQGIPDGAQFVQISFLAFGQIPAPAAQQGKKVHVGFIIGIIEYHRLVRLSQSV